MRSKGNKDEDDGDKETRGNPSGNDVVAIRGVELHPTEEKNEIQWRSLLVIEPPDDHDLDEKEKDAENSGEPPGQLYDLAHFWVRWLKNCAGSLQRHNRYNI